MKLVIDHLTRYGYDEEVKFSTQYLRLTPRSTGRQTITAWTLTLPDGAAVTTTDGWGNVLHVLTLDNPHKEITIRASGIVDIADEGEETRDEEAELLSPLVFLRSTPLTRADTAIREFAQRLYRPDAAEESLNQLMADLLLRMPYSPRRDPGPGLRCRRLRPGEGRVPGSYPCFSRLLPGAGDPGALRQRLCLQR
ncbi:protein containing transglutaminase-like domain [Klebsiella quasipneumoniae]|nr:protein containing transglutaminase-like domain [Klebsiella quasipneumoniae]